MDDMKDGASYAWVGIGRLCKLQAQALKRIADANATALTQMADAMEKQSRATDGLQLPTLLGAAVSQYCRETAAIGSETAREAISTLKEHREAAPANIGEAWKSIAAPGAMFAPWGAWMNLMSAAAPERGAEERPSGRGAK